jgi:hypothetical protein
LVLVLVALEIELEPHRYVFTAQFAPALYHRLWSSSNLQNPHPAQARRMQQYIPSN